MAAADVYDRLVGIFVAAPFEGRGGVFLCCESSSLVQGKGLFSLHVMALLSLCTIESRSKHPIVVFYHATAGYIFFAWRPFALLRVASASCKPSTSTRSI